MTRGLQLLVDELTVPMLSIHQRRRALHSRDVFQIRPDMARMDQIHHCS